VTVNNRLVGMIHGAFTADLPTCHRQVHTVAHPGGDDVDERGNRRRHQPKPARLRLRADRGLRAGCAATCGPWASRLLRVPPDAPGSGRGGRGTPLHGPLLRVGRRGWHRSLFRRDFGSRPHGSGAASDRGQTRPGQRRIHADRTGDLFRT